MELDMVADMEVDKVADMVADNKKATFTLKWKFNLVRESRGLVNWVQTFSTQNLPGLHIFDAL